MNRRSFLKRLGISVAGLACGAKLLSEAATARPPPEIKRNLKPNPAWVDAPYEEKFFFANRDAARLAGDIYEMIIRKSPYIDLIEDGAIQSYP